MSTKPHNRPHPKKRQVSPIIRLVVAALIIIVFVALATALAASGHGVRPHGYIP